jgi:hypothetical protein
MLLMFKETLTSSQAARVATPLIIYGATGAEATWATAVTPGAKV